MDALFQDLRQAWRDLRRSPTFALVAILTLALGIGANAAIFSVANSVLLRPLPYEDPDRLVRLWGVNLPQEVTQANSSAHDIEDWRAMGGGVFAGVAAMVQQSTALTGEGEPLRVREAAVSTNFFPLLGVEPIRGRSFLPEEGTVGKNRVVFLGEGLWKRQFGSADLLGRTITLNGNSYTVVGIVGSGFKSPLPSLDGEPELWRPLAIDLADANRGGRFLTAFARLAPGVSLSQAQARMDEINARLAKEYPDTNKDWRAQVEPLHASIVGAARPGLLVLLGAVGFVLLIACANLANLLLVRASTRSQDFAVRTAFGATRKRLARQLLTESCLLGLLGGAAGLLLAFWSSRWLIHNTAGYLPRQDEIGFDFRVLAFTLALSLLTGLLFGLFPALRVSRSDLQAVLREGRQGKAAGPGGNRLRGALVIAEIGLSLVLMIGAGLMLRSFHRLRQIDPGFKAEGALTLQLSLPSSRYPERSQKRAFFQQLTERVGLLPGVQAAGLVNMLPLSGSYSCDSFTIPGRPVNPGEEPCAETRSITPGYFRAMGVSLLAGRSFNDHDDASAPFVVIINQTMARRFWPGEDPVGKTVDLTEVPRQVVGVVQDVHHFGLDTEATPEVYQPLPQATPGGVTLVVRSQGNLQALVGPVRQQIWEMDPELPVYDVKTMEEALSGSIARPRFQTFLLGTFALLALVLAAVGVASVMAYSVNERTHEIGVRMALGARQGDVLRMVMARSLTLTLLGIGLGLGAAYALADTLSRLLFSVSPTDPLTFLVVPVLLGAVALLASYLPARRTTQIDPLLALRG